MKYFRNTRYTEAEIAEWFSGFIEAMLIMMLMLMMLIMKMTLMILPSDENENDYEYNVDDNAVGLWIYLSVILAGQIEFKSTLK